MIGKGNKSAIKPLINVSYPGVSTKAILPPSNVGHERRAITNTLHGLVRILHFRFGSSVRVPVFPIPPLQLLRVVLCLGGEIHGASQHIQHATINRLSDSLAQLSVQSLRVLIPQVFYPPYAKQPQVICGAWPNAGNHLQFICRIVSGFLHVVCLQGLTIELSGCERSERERNEPPLQ